MKPYGIFDNEKHRFGQTIPLLKNNIGQDLVPVCAPYLRCVSWIQIVRNYILVCYDRVVEEVVTMLLRLSPRER